MKYDIFISYRRNGAEYLAHNLYERLTAKGYSVFQDIESLKSGKFNEQLYDIIENCNDFLLIIPPNGLDRCWNKEDWVKNEIVHALKHKKNIIPIMMPGFEWPEILPEEINDIRYLNSLVPSVDYFDNFVEKISEFLYSSCKSNKNKRTHYKIFRKLFLIIFYILLMTIPVFIKNICNIEFDLWFKIVYSLGIVFGAWYLLNLIETKPNIASACFSTITEHDLNEKPEILFSNLVGIFGRKIYISDEPKKNCIIYYKLKRLEFGSWDLKKINYLKIVFRKRLEYYDPSLLYLHSLSYGEQSVKMLTKQGFILQTNPNIISKQNSHYMKKGNLHIFIYYKFHKLDYVVVYNCSEEELKKYYIED